MSSLVESLLDFSRLSDQPPHYQLISLSQVLEEVKSLLEVAITEASPQITIEALPQVWGDKSLLIRLFQNLLSNAIKFSRLDLSGRAQRSIIHISFL